MVYIFHFFYPTMWLILFKDIIYSFQAAEILNGRLQYEVIKTGFQDGGLCAKFDIEVGSFA